MEGDLFGLLPPQEDLLFAQSLAMLSNAWHQVFFPQERCSLAEAQSSRQGGPLCDESASHRSQVRGPWANGQVGLGKLHQEDLLFGEDDQRIAII